MDQSKFHTHNIKELYEDLHAIFRPEEPVTYQPLVILDKEHMLAHERLMFRDDLMSIEIGDGESVFVIAKLEKLPHDLDNMYVIVAPGGMTLAFEDEMEMIR